jgi:hypothetical protein
MEIIVKIRKISIIILGILLALNSSCSLPEPIDIAPPVVVILYPIGGTNISGTITITVGASDDDKVKRVWYYLDGQMMGSSGSASPQFELDVSPYADNRLHSFVGAAQDESDNVGYSPATQVTITQYIDSEPPVVTLTYPTAGQLVQNFIKIVAVATDNTGIKQVALFINSDSVTTITQYPYEYSWDIPLEEAGQNITLYAKAYDLYNNWSISPIVSVINSIGSDVTPPIVNLLNPLAGQVLTGIVDVIVDASDAVALDRIEYFVDGNRLHIISADITDSPFIYRWDTREYEEKSTHNLYVKAVDRAGNETVIPSINFLISVTGEEDLEAPTATILYPIPGPISTDTVTIRINAEDNIGVVRSEFYIDGTLKDMDIDEPWEYNWDLSGYEDNSIHSVYVKVYDAAENVGNTGVTNYTISRAVDETPPVITLLYPLAAAITSTVDVAVDVYDEGGVDRVEFYVDGVLEATDTQAPWGWTWDTTVRADSLGHTLFIKAYDTSDNIGVAGPITYVIN